MVLNPVALDGRLERIKELAFNIEAGNEDEANRLLDELAKTRESSLFQELGKLTRELHDALNGFHVDSDISKLAEKDIPDAKERLDYVINMTEQSANKTLTAVESTLPIAEELSARAVRINGEWNRFRQRQLTVEEFRALSGDISEFMSWVVNNAEVLRGGLSDVLMAQDFQDLTGQIIRRVISLVQEVESKLVTLIRVSGHKNAIAPINDDALKAEGPHVPGTHGPGVVQGQDDVDDLLSSLGF